MSRPAACLLIGLVVLGSTACSDDSPPPLAEVVCPPGSVQITVTNRSTEIERYTVRVTFTRAGDTEREEYSSNAVPAGESATITDSRPDEPQTCSIDRTEVFR